MNDQQDAYHSLIRRFKQRWDDEGAARDERARRAKEIFLEDQLAPIEHYLTRLDKVVHAVGASVEISPVWEHLDDQRLGRAAKVACSDPNRHHSLQFTIQGVSIVFRDRPYSLSNGVEALMRVITHEVERSQATMSVERRNSYAVGPLSPLLAGARYWLGGADPAAVIVSV